MIVERFFDNRTNTATLTVDEPEGTPKPWTGVDHMALHLIDKAGVLSEQSFDPATTQVDYTTDGVLVFDLGEESVPAGRWKVELTAVDGASNKAQVIHWDRDKVEFIFSTTQTVT